MYIKKIYQDEEIILLKALRSGNQQAFEQIYKLYSARIYWNIFKLVKSEDNAKELLQEVFFKIWEKRLNIDPEQSFRSYLFQISKNTVYSYLRKNNLEKQVRDYLKLHHTEGYSHVEEHIEYSESEEFLNQTIAQLPPKRREIFKLCKLEGKSYEEVSAQLGISTSTINDHIVKATKFIKGRHNGFNDHLLLIAAVSILFKQI